MLKWFSVFFHYCHCLFNVAFYAPQYVITYLCWVLGLLSVHQPCNCLLGMQRMSQMRRSHGWEIQPNFVCQKLSKEKPICSSIAMKKSRCVLLHSWKGTMQTSVYTLYLHLSIDHKYALIFSLCT